MEESFWLDKWKKREIGFHQTQVNPFLQIFFEGKELQAKKVFIPLCGKSKDMIWLREQGAEIVGCEFSELALDEFFLENGLKENKKTKTETGLVKRSSDGFTLYQGDFFNLPEIGHMDYVYDRAALIALPPATRKDYAKKLKSLLSPDTQELLIAIEYDQSLRDGPPFSVERKEIERLFSPAQAKIIREEKVEGARFGEQEIQIKNVVYRIKGF